MPLYLYLLLFSLLLPTITQAQLTENEKLTHKFIHRQRDFTNRRMGINPTENFAQQYYFGQQQALNLKYGVQYKKQHEWTPIGPMGKERLAGTGRVNCVAFHPKDTGSLFIGVAQGGIWRSTNSGQSWTNISSNLPVLRISAIAINPINPDILYVATGDFAYLGHNLPSNDNQRHTHYGLGIYQSRDGGQSWQATGLSFKQTDFQGSLISQLMIHPSDTAKLLAFAHDGIYQSTNSGKDFNKVTNGIFWDAKFAPHDPNRLYASSGYVLTHKNGEAAIWYSDDFGSTWNSASVPFNKTGEVQRIELAVCASNPAKVYALASDANDRSNRGSGFEGIYVSTDTGKTFTTVIHKDQYPNNLLNWDFSDDEGGQGTYDLSFFVDRDDQDQLHVGGVNIWTSKDGGKNFNPSTYGRLNYRGRSLHSDVHSIVQHPVTKRYFVCHDGGISSTKQITPTTIENLTEFEQDATNWQHHITNLNTLSFYRMAVKPSNASEMVAGAQDNSTSLLRDDAWFSISGGDGMEAAFGDEMLFTSSQYGYVYHFYEISGEYRYLDYFYPPDDEQAEWTSPFSYVNGRVSIGYGNVYKVLSGFLKAQTDFSNASGKDHPLPISALWTNPDDKDEFYVAQRGYLLDNLKGAVWYTNNAETGLQNRSSGLPLHLFPTYVVAQEAQPETAYISFGGFDAGKKVYRTTNAGETWENISYNLPNLPVNCVVYQNDANGYLYCATDLGVYYLDTAQQKWEAYWEGLPNVIVSELDIHLEDFTLRAATFGQGIWECSLMGFPDPIGTNEAPMAQVQLEAFPNPAIQAPLQLRLTEGLDNDAWVEVRNITGQAVWQGTWAAQTTEITLPSENWLSGQYFAILHLAKSRSTVRFQVQNAN